MNNIGGLNRAKNAGLRAFYRFADGELPFRDTDNFNVAVNLEAGKKLFELMEVLEIAKGPPLEITRYCFTPFSGGGEDESGVLAMSATFETRIPPTVSNGLFLVEFNLENPGGIWCVKEVVFHPTPAQQETYFSGRKIRYELWQ